MSIVRIGLAETKNFAQGYGAIFGKKSASKEDKPTAKAGKSKKKSGKKKK